MRADMEGWARRAIERSTDTHVLVHHGDEEVVEEGLAVELLLCGRHQLRLPARCAGAALAQAGRRQPAGRPPREWPELINSDGFSS
jgi:hypothetical protein